jgi:tRNA G18 (ribose-2'-O)-methylase SpoU
MGSAFRLPHVRRIAAAEAIDRARAHRLQVLAAESKAAVAYDGLDLARPTALVVGAEGPGLPPEVAAAADLRVGVPMRSPVESLNVGVAAGVILFEAARQRRG